MSKTILVGLGSKARIGKDFAAKELAQIFSLERVAFADALKKDVAAILAKNGLDYWAMEKKPEQKEKVRPLLVEYGMTMRRFDENFWVNKALENRDFNAQLTLVTDVRFPNEAKRIKELGGYYVEVVTNTPPANETEAYYSPLMAGLADYNVYNNFDNEFISALSTLIADFDNIETRLCKKIQFAKSKATSSTAGSTSSFMLGPNLSFQLGK